MRKIIFGSENERVPRRFSRKSPRAAPPCVHSAIAVCLHFIMQYASPASQDGVQFVLTRSYPRKIKLYGDFAVSSLKSLSPLAVWEQFSDFLHYNQNSNSKKFK